MKILLDECLPRKIKNSLAMHECRTVPEVGLAGKRNGELLSLAEEQGYEIFVTMDKGVEYEQNLRARKLAIIILRAKSNRLGDLLPLLPACLARMESIKRGEVVSVGG
jgi:predicted nuclease of predicted toxin-antitoxin system